MNYLPMTITLAEPVRVTKTHAKKGQNMSSNYISGSVIRGAIISRYVKQLDDYKAELLKGGIKFLNAYPLIKKQRSLPFPLCYYAKKSDIRQGENKLDFRVGLGNAVEEGDIAVKSNDFVVYHQTNYKAGVSIREDLYLDIKEGENDNLFRYESIDKGQIFKSYIAYDDRTSKELLNKIERIKVLYLGGRRGTGFGKCEIEFGDVIATNPEQGEVVDANCIDLLAVSDAFLYDSNLQPLTGFGKINIEQLFGVSAADIYQNVATETQSSFNSKWMARTPFCEVIKAGSVIRIKSDANIDGAALCKRLENGIGARTSEGFGRFCVVNALQSTTFVKTAVDFCGQMNGVNLSTVANDEMIERITKQIQLSPYAEENLAGIKRAKELFGDKELNNSFLSDIRLKLMQALKADTRAEALAIVNKYFDHIQAKIKNSRNQKMFTSKGLPVKDVIVNFIKEGDDYTRQIGYLLEAFRLIMRGVK